MICPNCGHLSPEKFAICPKCGTHAEGYGHCSHCGSEMNIRTNLYCTECGAVNAELASDQGLVCDTHVENRAVGFCVVCGKAVCEECLESSSNRILCDDPKHRTMLDDWKVIHRFDFEYEAAMLYANLEQQEIESEVFSKPNPDTTDTLPRPTIVEVLVPKKKFEEALEIAKTLGLTDDQFGEDEE